MSERSPERDPQLPDSYVPASEYDPDRRVRDSLDQLARSLEATLGAGGKAAHALELPSEGAVPAFIVASWFERSYDIFHGPYWTAYVTTNGYVVIRTDGYQGLGGWAVAADEGQPARVDFNGDRMVHVFSRDPLLVNRQQFVGLFSSESVVHAYPTGGLS